MALRARYVFPIDCEPVADGVVVIEGQRIATVRRWPLGEATADEVIELGSVALLPGLVNAHAHLEFSDLPRPLGRPGMVFPDWIRKVIARRYEAATDMRAAVAAGLAESLRGGVTTLGEIATTGWSGEPFAGSPIATTVFLELIGLGSGLIEERLASARQHLNSSASSESTPWRAGISPHAPYSVHLELFARCVELARQTGAPLAVHLAESREELQLLRDGTGPFRTLLEELGVWNDAAIPRGTRPLDYLERLAKAPRALVIHGNYLEQDEIALLARHADTMSVVYCPRTHAYFGHEPYPLARLLEAGVKVAVGTDSRASNPDLSLLQEMRHVARGSEARAGKVPLATILSLGTLGGAKALGQADEIGSLEPGKLADLCAVELEGADVTDPHKMLLLSDGSVTATWKAGRLVYDARASANADRAGDRA